MIHIVLAYSDADMDSETDESLGRYFSSCANDLKGFLKSYTEQYELQELSGKNLNPVHLEILLEQLGSKKIIFIAYSHGREYALTHNGMSYIEIHQNTSLYRGAFIYTNACLAGKTLGPHLIEKGCSAFCGYDNEVVVGVPYYSIFCECENHGIKEFLQGETLEGVYHNMIDLYTERIDDLYNYSVVAAALLQKNRDALVLFGNKKLVIRDLVC